MPCVFTHFSSEKRRLAPFFVFALLLHIALLWAIHPSTNTRKISRPIMVYLTQPVATAKPSYTTMPATQAHKVASKVTTPTNPKLSESKAKISLPTAASTLSENTPTLNTQQLLESAKDIARNEARRTEEQIASQEKKQLNTPVAAMLKTFKQPQKEVRLANGMLKITTETGTFCFQPPPAFARDQAGLYGIPSTCP